MAGWRSRPTRVLGKAGGATATSSRFLMRPRGKVSHLSWDTFPAALLIRKSLTFPRNSRTAINRLKTPLLATGRLSWKLSKGLDDTGRQTCHRRSWRRSAKSGVGVRFAARWSSIYAPVVRFFSDSGRRWQRGPAHDRTQGWERQPTGPRGTGANPFSDSGMPCRVNPNLHVMKGNNRPQTALSRWRLQRRPRGRRLPKRRRSTCRFFGFPKPSLPD